jgi:hypothetical protein
VSVNTVNFLNRNRALFAHIRIIVYVLQEMSRRCTTMEIEILYFDGCPTYKMAEKTLQEVIAEEGMDAEIKLVAVNSDSEAQQVRFAGSPTIRVDGEDLFPVPERAEYALGCRMYATPEGLRGAPTDEMFSEALRRKEGGGAKGSL